MEKADILEMTVAYLQVTHSRRHPRLDLPPSGGVDRYAAGFRECAVHVGRYLLDSGVSFGAIHDRLMSHLDKALKAVVNVDGCGRMSGADMFESVADVSMEKVSWTGDCDTTGRCSPDADDDDCRSVSGTVSGVSDVVRRQYAGCGTRVTTDIQLLTNTAATTSSSTTTTTSFRQPLHPSADVDSPRSADEFPLFPPSSATTVVDNYSSAQPSDVAVDLDNDLVIACDTGSDVRDVSRVTSSLSISSPITSFDTVTDDSSDVWQPWR